MSIDLLYNRVQDTVYEHIAHTTSLINSTIDSVLSIFYIKIINKVSERPICLILNKTCPLTLLWPEVPYGINE